MPLKNPNPFDSSADRLDPGVNPYVARLREAARDGSLPLTFGTLLEGFRGQWRERIAAAHGVSRPFTNLIVEIGCHKGQTLMAMARDYPDTAFVGLDITYKRVVTTAERARVAGLQNVFCAMANAQGIDQLFAPGEVDGVVIFFPDPWVKKARQSKHRLIEPTFVERLSRVVAPGGCVWLKTDQEIYFEGAKAAFAQSPFTPLAAAASSRREKSEPGPLGPDGLAGVPDYSSAFEQRFQAQNLPTYAAKWLRSAGLREELA